MAVLHREKGSNRLCAGRRLWVETNCLTSISDMYNLLFLQLFFQQSWMTVGCSDDATMTRNTRVGNTSSQVPHMMDYAKVCNLLYRGGRLSVFQATDGGCSLHCVHLSGVKIEQLLPDFRYL